MVMQVRLSAAQACERTLRDLGLTKTLPAGAGIPEAERFQVEVEAGRYYNARKTQYCVKRWLKIKEGREKLWRS